MASETTAGPGTMGAYLSEPIRDKVWWHLVVLAGVCRWGGRAETGLARMLPACVFLLELRAQPLQQAWGVPARRIGWRVSSTRRGEAKRAWGLEYQRRGQEVVVDIFDVEGVSGWGSVPLSVDHVPTGKRAFCDFHSESVLRSWGSTITANSRVLETCHIPSAPLQSTLPLLELAVTKPTAVPSCVCVCLLSSHHKQRGISSPLYPPFGDIAENPETNTVRARGERQEEPQVHSRKE